VTSGWVFLVTFASIMAGVGLGMTLRARHPEGYLNAEIKEVVQLGVGLLATLAAVVISLMIASVASSYETQDAHSRKLASHTVLVDQLLAHYGSEAAEVRKLMRQAVPRRDKVRGPLQDIAFSTSSVADELYKAIETLTPANDEQRALKLLIAQAGTDIANARQLVLSEVDTPIMTPLLPILMFWLTVIFTSFSLFVQPGPVIIAALLVLALSISSALFMVADADLGQPFAGLMQISSQPLRHAGLIGDDGRWIYP
jgi:hypothetical protein